MSGTIRLVVESEQETLASKLLGRADATPGDVIQLSEEVRIRFERESPLGAFDGGALAGSYAFILEFATATGASLLANFLFEKLRSRATKGRINREAVEISEDDLRRVLMAKLDSGSRRPDRGH